MYVHIIIFTILHVSVYTFTCMTIVYTMYHVLYVLYIYMYMYMYYMYCIVTCACACTTIIHTMYMYCIFTCTCTYIHSCITSPPVHIHDEMDIVGHDGHIYKGRTSKHNLPPIMKVLELYIHYNYYNYIKPDYIKS